MTNWMKKTAALALAGGIILAGCNSPTTETATTEGAATETTTAAEGTPVATVADTGAPLGTVKVGDQHVCAVCAVKEGSTEAEEVKETIDYKGETYAFCNVDEKAEFISDPAKYAGAAE